MVEREIEKFLGKVIEKFKPRLVILFGSRARGDYLKSSDYDILIVSEHFRKLDFRERIVRIYELMDEPLRVDVLCYTPEEFEKKRKELGIVRKALEEGVVLYGEKPEGENN